MILLLEIYLDSEWVCDRKSFFFNVYFQELFWYDMLRKEILNLFYHLINKSTKEKWKFKIKFIECIKLN